MTESKPDRFAEKARAILESTPCGLDCSYCSNEVHAIAQALRDSAADAFEEAAELARGDWRVPKVDRSEYGHGRYDTQDRIVEHLKAKAATLRGGK